MKMSSVRSISGTERNTTHFTTRQSMNMNWREDLVPVSTCLGISRVNVAALQTNKKKKKKKKKRSWGGLLIFVHRHILGKGNSVSIIIVAQTRHYYRQTYKFDFILVPSASTFTGAFQWHLFTLCEYLLNREWPSSSLARKDAREADRLCSMSKRARSNTTAEEKEEEEEIGSPSTSSVYSDRSKRYIQSAQPTPVMRCSLPPHREVLSFSSFEDYEVHYMQAHVNRCMDCGRNFPTDRLLNLHIEENHDPLIAVLSDRGEKAV